MGTLRSRRLIEYDRNGDGYLEASELPERSRSMIERADRDGDGKLSREELTTARRSSFRRRSRRRREK